MRNEVVLGVNLITNTRGVFVEFKFFWTSANRDTDSTGSFQI